MASTKEYLDFVLEQLSELDEISSRAMMGEYILYYRGKVFGGIYDDRLLVKPVPAAVKLMPDQGYWRAIRTISANSSELQIEGNRLMYTDKSVAKNYGKGYIYSVAAKKGNLV